jgi:hypothetical protein
VAAREVAHLRLPIGVVGGEFVQENDRRPASCFFEIQADIIAGDGVGHLIFLPGASGFIALESRVSLFVLTRFLHADRQPLRSKTLCQPAPKIAVNAVGCNEAESILFRHGIIAE